MIDDWFWNRRTQAPPQSVRKLKKPKGEARDCRLTTCPIFKHLIPRQNPQETQNWRDSFRVTCETKLFSIQLPGGVKTAWLMTASQSRLRRQHGTTVRAFGSTHHAFDVLDFHQMIYYWCLYGYIEFFQRSILEDEVTWCSDALQRSVFFGLLRWEVPT